MLHRLLRVVLLGIGLGVASVPAQACGREVPMERCCPSDPAQPCRDTGSIGVGAASATGACCSARVPAAPVAAIALSVKAEAQFLPVTPSAADAATDSGVSRRIAAAAVDFATP